MPCASRWVRSWCRATVCLLLFLSPLHASEEGLKPVTVQLKWTHQFQFAGYYAALHQGYYRDAGLDVQVIEYVSGSTPVDSLLAGRADFAVADSGALIYASGGVPLVALAAIFQRSPSILVTLANSGINELADLRGRRAMLSGGFMNAELMAMLKSAGLDDGDVVMVPGDTDLGVLIRGDVDAFNAYTTNEPYQLRASGIDFNVFAPTDYGVDFYGDILLTTEATLRSDPDMVARFREATLRGWTHAVENPEATVDLVMRHYNTQGKSRNHLLFEAREVVSMIMPELVPVGYMNRERWQRIEGVFRDQGVLSRPVDMERFIYKPVAEPGVIIELLSRYRVHIFSVMVLLLGLMMALYIIMLRAQVRSRTRALQAEKHRAEQDARTDALTGLPNRRHFLESLRLDMARADRLGVPLSVVSLDIDHFKQINDRLGHAAGDAALKAMGALFGQHLRAGDIAARVGGEEFALSCIDTNQEQVLQLVERIRNAIENLAVDHAGATFGFTISAGVAHREPGDDVERLLHRSDRALYRAKEAGRNRVEWSRAGTAG
jgi:diguanylate cyclase (GGDEF)-like protein